jgi:multiple sugar transport system ATP-binding protein
MNLVPAELRGGTLHVAGIELRLARTALQDGPVIAGIRPTDLKAEPGDDDGGRLRAELEVVERLGSESHVIFAVDAPEVAGEVAAAAHEATEDGEARLLAGDERARFTAVIPGRARLAPGDVVELGIPADAVHLFDPATGDTLR